MCKAETESVDHLFLHYCPTTQYLWNKLDIIQGLDSIKIQPNNLPKKLAFPSTRGQNLGLFASTMWLLSYGRYGLKGTKEYSKMAPKAQLSYGKMLATTHNYGRQK